MTKDAGMEEFYGKMGGSSDPFHFTPHPAAPYKLLYSMERRD